VATLTDAQIAGAATSAGFSGAALAKAVAIALAESGGNPNAHNAVPPDNSYGLWQINMLGSMGPARRKQFGLTSNDQLFNPATNAKAAYAIANNGKSFTPWSTYTSGAYLRYMSRANKAAGNPDTSGTTTGTQTGLTDVLSWPGDIVAFFTLLTNPITWKRLGMIVGGGILVMVALGEISGLGSKVQQGVSVAANMLPEGKALKGASAASKVA
jgi:hypothetical protein